MSPYKLTECKDPKYFISWGCGVQSTALSVMSALGKIKKVDAIITADTGWERQITYEIRNWYLEWLKDKIPTYIVSNGNIQTDANKDHSDLPLWYGKQGAPLRRQCTAYYKIEPIRRKIRELCGLRADNKGRTRKNTAILYLGISTDEAKRMSDSNRTWIKNEYPLIDLGMSRKDCQDYLLGLGLPLPPKSACVCCPFTSTDRWLNLKNTSPNEWADAVEFDEKIRIPPERMLKRGFTENCFLWSKKKPLKELELVEEIDPLNDVCDSGYCFV